MNTQCLNQIKPPFRPYAYLLLWVLLLFAQFPVASLAQNAQQWTKDGNSYWTPEKGEIVQYTLPEQTRSVIATTAMLTPAGKTEALRRLPRQSTRSC